MNATQRAVIEKHNKAIDAIRSDLEGVKDENQDSYDNMPEGLQEADNGVAMSDAIENLDSACNALQEAIDFLDNIN